MAAGVSRLLTSGAEAALEHDRLFRLAYPVARSGPRLALEQDDGG